MKYLKIFLLIFTIILFSCDDKKGDTTQVFNGTENLPEEIKGFKLYWVKTSDGFAASGVYIGFLEGYNTTSLTYQSGKTNTSVILVTHKNEIKTILVKEILVENDSIIVIKKLKK